MNSKYYFLLFLIFHTICISCTIIDTYVKPSKLHETCDGNIEPHTSSGDDMCNSGVCHVEDSKNDGCMRIICNNSEMEMCNGTTNENDYLKSKYDEEIKRKISHMSFVIIGTIIVSSMIAFPIIPLIIASTLTAAVLFERTVGF